MEFESSGGRNKIQYVAQCVACAALTLVVWQYITNIPSANIRITTPPGKEEFFKIRMICTQSPVLRITKQTEEGNGQTEDQGVGENI